MVKKTIPKKIIKQINTYLEVLKQEKFPISEVYLFGSYAKGNYNKDSDIDLCIISPKLDNTLSSIQYLASQTIDIKDNIIEPIGFSPAYFKKAFSDLVFEVKRTGVKII